MIQKILFPVDFSPSLVGMAVYVKGAAAIFGAEVTLVHVFDLSSHDGYRPLRTNARREYLFRRSWGHAGSDLFPDPGLTLSSHECLNGPIHEHGAKCSEMKCNLHCNLRSD